METTKLYKGRVILTLSDRHKYSAVIDKKKPVQPYGVTSITNILSKPFLTPWAIKLTAEEIMKEFEKLGSGRFIANFQRIVTTAKSASKRESNVTMGTGTQIHNSVEKILSGKSAKSVIKRAEGFLRCDEIKLGILAFLQFQSKHKLKPKFLERKIFSIKHCYAGTLDYYGDVDGKITVLDWKSSKAIYEGYDLQVAGYANALEEEGFPVDQTMIVRLGKDGALEVQVDKNWKDKVPYFLSAVNLYKYRMNRIKSDKNIKITVKSKVLKK